MAGNIKGITIEIDGDTQPLQKALREVNSESQKTVKELKDIDKALKFDPSNVILLGQKQELLQKQVKSTKEKLESLVKAQKQVEEEFKKGNIAPEEYRKFQREIETTKSMLGAYENKLENVTNALSENAQATGNNAKKLEDMQEKTNKLLKADVMMNFADKAGQVGQAMVGFGQKTLDAFEEVDSGLDIDLYVAGKKMETYPNDNTFETIYSGRSLEGAVAHFGVVGSGDMELEVKPFAAFGEKPAIVAFTLE